MILPMKHLIFAIAFALVLSVSSSAQQDTGTQKSITGPPQPAGKKVDIKPPKAIKTPDPDSIFFAKAKQKAVFKVQVGSDGLVHEPALVQSCGNEKADAAALEAVRRWTFKPATRDGIPVAVFINVEVVPIPQ